MGATNNDFIDCLKNRVAKLAIGASTLRNQGAGGVVAAARRGLNRIDLPTFAVSNEAAFIGRLDAVTGALQSKFPKGGRSWGGARKAVNIFLRDVVYSTDLSDHFDLHGIRAWLEVPLDSQIAKALRAEREGAGLPRWPRIKHLRPEISALYQRVASKVAKRQGIKRVDLDVFYWRAEPV
ncbi:MAG: hypothetical protein WD847_07355 [Pirellulales bacterium]